MLLLLPHSSTYNGHRPGRKACRTPLQMSLSSLWKGLFTTRASGKEWFHLSCQNLTSSRLATSALTPARNHLSAHFPPAKNAFLAQMNSLVTPVSTTMIILILKSSILPRPKSPQKSNQIIPLNILLELSPILLLLLG